MSGRDQAAFYDKDKPFVTEERNRRIERICEFLLASVRDPAMGPLQKALDIGCANGTVLGALPPGVERHGLDVSDELLRLAQAKGILTRNADVDVNPLPYPDGTFDLVIATDVIEHILHTDRLLNEINRVLRPGGLLVAGIPNINQPVSLVMQFVLDLTPMYASRYRCPHYRDFTHRLFRHILRKHGFAVCRQEGSYLYPFERSRLLTALVRRWIPRWGCQILYAGRKTAAVSVEEGFSENMPALLTWLKQG